ncbi:heavy-metal-associated domain-containing protein [Sulfurospirillum cavolei]|uniref:heavy-metal-associated domain-containing protein n=1 Tax=Sulfurospirillum cavolei TaxID=366522 RepID=UPI003FA310EE
MANITLTVKGMCCMGCVKSVKGVLEAINGVSKVDVDLASGKTIIEYDAPIDVSVFEKAIDEAGFEVEQ